MAQASTSHIDDGRAARDPVSGPYPSGETMVGISTQPGYPDGRGDTDLAHEPWDAAAARIVGRTIFGAYFIYNGINHFVNHRQMTEHARSKGVPAPGFAVAASGLMILAGGIAIATGVHARLGAGLITGFLLSVSPQMHAFWRDTDPQERMNDNINFGKNMALLGAALLAGGGRPVTGLEH